MNIASLAISWSPDGLIGRISLDGMQWAAVEWSEKRQQWCIEDAAGQCLRHVGSIRGAAASKEEAVALATEMIADGRIPAPEQAWAELRERQQRAREKRDRQPSVQKRRAARQAEQEAFRRWCDLRRHDEEAPPLYEMLAETLDFADPNLWKSNSFAALKPRLITHLEAVIAELEWNGYARERATRLDRAKAILATLMATNSDSECEVLQNRMSRERKAL